MSELNEKQKTFCKEYIIDLNGTQAATRASIRINTPCSPYVYALSDPDTKEVFYIGKGRKNRMYQHEREAKVGMLGAKCDRIRNIKESGKCVVYTILGEYNTDKEAFDAEKMFISEHSGLTNILAGGGGERISNKEKAENMLNIIKPLHTWVAEMPSEIVAQVAHIFGSPKLCYEYIVNHI